MFIRKEIFRAYQVIGDSHVNTLFEVTYQLHKYVLEIDDGNQYAKIGFSLDMIPLSKCLVFLSFFRVYQKNLHRKSSFFT